MYLQTRIAKGNLTIPPGLALASRASQPFLTFPEASQSYLLQPSAACCWT